MGSWFEHFRRSNLDLNVSMTEKGDVVYFGSQDYPYPANPWNHLELGSFVLAKVEHLERSFKKKDVQYQELQDEFQEVFEMDDLTDEEEGSKLDDCL